MGGYRETPIKEGTLFFSRIYTLSGFCSILELPIRVSPQYKMGSCWLYGSRMWHIWQYPSFIVGWVLQLVEQKAGIILHGYQPLWWDFLYLFLRCGATMLILHSLLQMNPFYGYLERGTEFLWLNHADASLQMQEKELNKFCTILYVCAVSSFVG